MRTAIREAVLQEEMKERLSEKRKNCDKLVEKWSKKKGIGEGILEIYNENKDRGRGLALMLENQQEHLRKLTETTISSRFQTVPENVLRVIRLGYPNSIRSELFLEYPMETARDSVYYLTSVYADTARGATADKVTHETDSDRYASEIDQVDLTWDAVDEVWEAADSVLINNVIPFSAKIIADGKIVSVDDGRGNFLVNNYVEAGTIDYATGAVSGVTFKTAAFGDDQPTTVKIEYQFDSEVEANYAQIKKTTLQLRDVQFRARPYPLGLSWSKMTELLLGTTLGIDAEEALLKGAGDEFKKSLDFLAIRFAYRYASRMTPITFHARAGSLSGADSNIDQAQMITNAIADAGDTIFNKIQRGGVTKIVGGPKAVNQIMLHGRFSAAGAQPQIGGHKVGVLDGIDIYKVPQSIIPTDELMCIWRNDAVPEDAAIGLGTLIPLYTTDTLEFDTFHKEVGLAHFGDMRPLNTDYFARIKVDFTEGE